MTLLDFPLEARLRGIEERLTAIENRLVIIERDLAVLKARLDSLPTVWMFLGLILPLYGLMLFGFAGLFYFLLNYSR